VVSLFALNVVRSLATRIRFTYIYWTNGFGGEESRSGPGSSLAASEAIREGIPRVLDRLGVRSVLDAGCGDLNWIATIPLNLDLFIGVDVVHRHFGRKVGGNHCRQLFLCRDLALGPLPTVDLILCRDALVHLSLRHSCDVIRRFIGSGSTYLMATTFTDVTSNDELCGRRWRPLNLQLPPFGFPQPLCKICEHCTIGGGRYSDKHLALWQLQSLFAVQAHSGHRSTRNLKGNS